MEGGHHRELVVEGEEEEEREEKRELNLEVVDDPVARNGVDDDSHAYEIRLVAIVVLGAENAALRDSIATILVTPANPIQGELRREDLLEEKQVNAEEVTEEKDEEVGRAVNLEVVDDDFLARDG